MSEPEQEMNCAGALVGVIIIIGCFFGGFFMFFMGIDGDLGVGQILLFVLGIPMIGFVVGFAVIMYTNRNNLSTGFPSRTTSTLFRTVPRAEPVERSYVYEPPRTCDNCKGELSAENVEWAGPLTVRCPYCGATHPAEKRLV